MQWNYKSMHFSWQMLYPGREFVFSELKSNFGPSFKPSSFKPSTILTNWISGMRKQSKTHKNNEKQPRKSQRQSETIKNIQKQSKNNRKTIRPRRVKNNQKQSRTSHGTIKNNHGTITEQLKRSRNNQNSHDKKQSWTTTTQSTTINNNREILKSITKRHILMCQPSAPSWFSKLVCQAGVRVPISGVKKMRQDGVPS